MPTRAGHRGPLWPARASDGDSLLLSLRSLTSAEVVGDRRLQPPWQERPGQEDGCATRRCEPRVAFFQSLALERVQQIEVDPRAGAGRSKPTPKLK